MKTDISNFFSNLKVSDEEDDFERKEKEAAEKKAHERYIASGVPEKFFNTSIDSYVPGTPDEQKIKQTVVEFSDNPANRILIMLGNNGCGKSLLSCGIIRKFGGSYILSPDLCIAYDAATSFHAPKTREEIIKYYSTVKMLVIDECGKYVLNKELEKFLLSFIIIKRYENGLPTVLVTNGEKKEFIEFLGKACFDRLTEVCTTLEFRGASKRTRVA